MAPSLDFRFLLCSFIPGLPIYFFLVSAYPNFLLNCKDAMLVVISGVIILMLGLFVDLLRHSVEIIVEWCRICCLKRRLPDVWEFFSIGERERSQALQNDTYFGYISTSHLGAYHVWEFTGNIPLSILIGFLISAVSNHKLETIFRLFCDQSQASEYLHRVLETLIIIAGVSILLSWQTSYRWKQRISSCTGIERHVNYFFIVILGLFWIVTSYIASTRYQLFFFSP